MSSKKSIECKFCGCQWTVDIDQLKRQSAGYKSKVQETSTYRVECPDCGRGRMITVRAKEE